MNRVIRRGVVTAAATGMLVVLGTAAASADDCVNLSRNTDQAQATHGAKTYATGTELGDIAVKGHWVYLGDTWLFISPGTDYVESPVGPVDVSMLPGAQGNFTAGKGDGLLEQSGKASDGRRCTVMYNGHGIAGECGDEPTE